MDGSSFLDRVKPDLLRKHAGLWVCVSEYGIISMCAASKEDLERSIVPHHGCALQLVQIPSTL